MAQSLFAVVVGIATIGTYFVFLNQFLADKVGRKIMLAFTVFGMGFSSLLIFFSTNVIEYTIYLFMLYIFFSSDIWVIYINEECPSEKRAFWTNMILVGGVIGAILLPVFRSIYITETYSNWRGMTYFAIILGIPLSLIIFFSLKETIKFRELESGDSTEEHISITFRENLKKIFQSARRKEFIVILVISFLSGLNYIFISLGESFISNSPNLNQNDINIVVLVLSQSIILGYIITGVVADKYGRKPLLYIYSFLLPVAIFIAVFGSYSQEYALIFVCIGAGLANVCYWGLSVIVRLVTIEIVPTESRGTGSGMKSLVGAFGITSGLLISSFIILNYGLGFSFIFFSLLLLINLPLTYTFLKETKGVNLSKVI
jgi:MFS family permease